MDEPNEVAGTGVGGGASPLSRLLCRRAIVSFIDVANRRIRYFELRIGKEEVRELPYTVGLHNGLHMVFQMEGIIFDWRE